MSTERTPAEIAADAQTLFDSASKAFVPVNLVKAMELNVEFMHATVAHLEACEAEIASLKA